jgi:hypothetical protein
MRQLEEVMRVRHGLGLDEPNDFDLVTQDAVLATKCLQQERARALRLEP